MGNEHLPTHTWTDVATEWERTVVLVPLGATEQHGPHLPLGTDSHIAEAICQAAARKVTGVSVAPTLPFGASGEHAGFPGTVSIGYEALTYVLIELGRSLLPDVKAIVFASAHGGNDEAVRRACALLQSEGRNAIQWRPAVLNVDLHAGHDETSMMMFLAPETVRTDAMVDHPITDLPETMAILRTSGVRALSPSGVLGSPSSANLAHGESLFTQYVNDLSSFLAAVSQTG